MERLPALRCLLASTLLSESEELHFEEAPQLLPGSRCQTAGLGIAEKDPYRFLDSGQLDGFYVVFAAESGLLVFASKEFGLLVQFNDLVNFSSINY